MNQDDRRSQVCGMCFLPIADASVGNFPGADFIRVRGDWEVIGISSGEFKESCDTFGGVVKQELKAVVTDTGKANMGRIQELVRQEGLVLLDLSNGDCKVVGTDQFPVSFSTEYAGSPLKLTLSFKRDSAEFAKNLKSF